MYECHSNSTGTRAPGSANIPTNIDDPDDDDEDRGPTLLQFIGWILLGILCGGSFVFITGYSIFKCCVK